MKKTITILGALAIAGSPVLASSVAPYKTQNFQTILKPATAVSAKTNGLVNNIIVQAVSSDNFYFQARLNNSTYNGFPGFMNQIVNSSGVDWAQFFFQWLDDNDFASSQYSPDDHFPNLNDFTQHGFFHDPITWSSRLEEHMGHFGCWTDNKTETAYKMINGVNSDKYWANFGKNAENTYKQEAQAGNVTGIMLNFGFTWGGAFSGYGVIKPNFDIMTN